MMVWPVWPVAIRFAAPRAWSVDSQPDAVKARVTINSEE
jgi:hypothetical protein